MATRAIEGLELDPFENVATKDLAVVLSALVAYQGVLNRKLNKESNPGIKEFIVSDCAKVDALVSRIRVLEVMK